MSCLEEQKPVKTEPCFYKKPNILGPLIIIGGLGAGYYLFPECNDENGHNNRNIRKILMYGGIGIGGVILAKHIMNN